MRSCFALLVLAALGAQAQPLVGPRWYLSARGMLGQPAANISAREVERLERYLVFGAPYCTALAAQQYAANLAVAQSMGTYLASVGATAVDVQARAAALRAAAAFSSFPCAYAGKQLPVIPLPPPQPGDPPFALRAPDLGKVPDADQENAADLVIRYDTDAVRAASAWKSAETLRLSLAAKGMTLNAQTATSVGRFQPLFEQSAAALKEHNWDEALSNLQAAEATTQKVASVAGR
jgi:hypothetical protein